MVLGSVEDMFPDLGPPSPDLPPQPLPSGCGPISFKGQQQPLPIVKVIIAEREVDVEMDEVEPNWAAEMARGDRQWEDRLKALDEQWALSCEPQSRLGSQISYI